MKNKFNFYEIVKISSKRRALKEVNGCKGVICGMSQNEETGLWGYAVSVYGDEGYVWDMMENELIGTGKKESPHYFDSGVSVKIRVDPETGEGEIVGNDDEK